MENELMNIRNTAVSFIIEAESKQELEEVKLQFLGRSGKLTTLLKDIPKLPIERRPEIGVLANEVKQIIEEAIENAEKKFAKKKVEKIKKIDVTEPGIRPPLGHLHLITQAIEEVSGIFSRIGFTRVRYPEIEWDWYSYTALNFPENHPARDETETFFIQEEQHPNYGSMLLTPHTSSGQIREMQKGKTPIKMLNIAKTYRRQADISHTPMFHQFETLCIGENISIANLKGVLDYFAKSYFGPDRKTRIRPYHFQFTEPSFETDISCGACNGKGCRLCKEGWLELGGAGMVHPNVIKNAGLDPKKYTGFASGWGIERVVMMKRGIHDLRLLYTPKLELLQQF